MIPWPRLGSVLIPGRHWYGTRTVFSVRSFQARRTRIMAFLPAAALPAMRAALPPPRASLSTAGA